MKGLFSFVVLAFMLVFVMPLGCTSLSKTASKVSDDLGDKTNSGFAFIDIWKITASDATANGSPTGKKITIIGNIKSIPIKGKKGDIVKDYGEYHYIESPAWYNSDNVTKEETIILTGDSVNDLGEYLLNEFKNAKNKKDAVSEETPSAPD